MTLSVPNGIKDGNWGRDEARRVCISPEDNTGEQNRTGVTESSFSPVPVTGFQVPCFPLRVNEWQWQQLPGPTAFFHPSPEREEQETRAGRWLTVEGYLAPWWRHHSRAKYTEIRRRLPHCGAFLMTCLLGARNEMAARFVPMRLTRDGNQQTETPWRCRNSGLACAHRRRHAHASGTARGFLFAFPCQGGVCSPPASPVPVHEHAPAKLLTLHRRHDNRTPRGDSFIWVLLYNICSTSHR